MSELFRGELVSQKRRIRLVPLHAYKHWWTRCYFHLTEDARTFYYVTGHLYREVDPYIALEAVFAQWERSRPTPEERRALRAALRRAAARTELD